MSPSLLPDLAHLPVFLATCVVAACCIGLGVWTGARRIEHALIAGWGVACFMTVLAGTLTDVGLSRIMAAVAVAGIAGVARITVAAVRGTAVLTSLAAGRVVLLALPLMLCVEGIETIGWDDFAHWLPNLSYLCQHDHFPSPASPSASDHAGYPYGLALPGFAVFLLLGRVPDSCAIYWNVFMMLAASASIATLLAERLGTSHQRETVGWFCAAVGLLAGGLASPAFVPKILFSNMADAPTGAVLAVLGSIVFEWAGSSDRRRDPIALVFAALCVVLVDLRQANAALFGLMIAGCGLAWGRHRDVSGSRAVTSLAIGATPALLVLLLWGHYTKNRIPGGQFELLPFPEWRWTLFPETLRSMLRVMAAKVGLFASVLFIAARAALAFRRRDDLGQEARSVVIVSTVVCVGMIGFLGFTYLAAVFLPQEAAAAASFWRYMSETGPLAVLGVAAGIPRFRLPRASMHPAMVALVSFTLLLPVVTVKYYRPDLTSPVPALRKMAETVRAMVPPSASLLLVDFTGNGFAVLVVAYELTMSGAEFGLPPRVVIPYYRIEGITAEEAATTRFIGPQFVWLAEGAPEMVATFGMRLSSGCSYLLKWDDPVFTIVAAWRIGPYKWGTYRDGWSITAEPNCR